MALLRRSTRSGRADRRGPAPAPGRPRGPGRRRIAARRRARGRGRAAVLRAGRRNPAEVGCRGFARRWTASPASTPSARSTCTTAAATICWRSWSAASWTRRSRARARVAPPALRGPAPRRVRAASVPTAACRSREDAPRVTLVDVTPRSAAVSLFPRRGPGRRTVAVRPRRVHGGHRQQSAPPARRRRPRRRAAELLRQGRSRQAAPGRPAAARAASRRKACGWSGGPATPEKRRSGGPAGRGSPREAARGDDDGLAAEHDVDPRRRVAPELRAGRVAGDDRRRGLRRWPGRRRSTSRRGSGSQLALPFT